MKYFIHTFGCQMNESDSERISGFLQSRKLILAPKIEEANLVILNTCSVRQSAEERVFGMINRLKKLPKPPKIAVTGCVAAQNSVRLKNAADLVFKINELGKLTNDLQLTTDNASNDYFKINPQYENKFHAYVPIMTGCNNFCTYCVVPYARGREKSREPKEILNEIKCLIKKGYCAITLIGQNVNSYGVGLREKIDFPKLLKKIDAMINRFSTYKTNHGGPPTPLGTNPRLKPWIWFLTSHPKDMSDELIKTIAASKHICHYIHLPIQAGDNEILARMNRGYTSTQYLKLISKIKKAMPDAAISTDVIVGFPSETRTQFQKTVDLFKKVKFDMAYMAQYSSRLGTAAHNLKDNVSTREKKRRHKILDELLHQISFQKNKKLLGKTIEVLIESEKNGIYFGKTKTMKTVKLTHTPIPFATAKVRGTATNNNSLVGKIISVKIKKIRDFGLET